MQQLYEGFDRCYLFAYQNHHIQCKSPVSEIILREREREGGGEERERGDGQQQHSTNPPKQIKGLKNNKPFQNAIDCLFLEIY